MYFDEPVAGSHEGPLMADGEMRIALSVVGALILLLGLAPQFLLDLCADAMIKTLGG
jgi:NADH-quinone oxidoreductase subunit N